MLPTVHSVASAAIVKGIRFVCKIEMSSITKQVASSMHQVPHHFRVIRYALNRGGTVALHIVHAKCVTRGGT